MSFRTIAVFPSTNAASNSKSSEGRVLGRSLRWLRRLSSVAFASDIEQAVVRSAVA